MSPAAVFTPDRRPAASSSPWPTVSPAARRALAIVAIVAGGIAVAALAPALALAALLFAGPIAAIAFVTDRAGAGSPADGDMIRLVLAVPSPRA